jgi:hypothetical protein
MVDVSTLAEKTGGTATQIKVRIPADGKLAIPPLHGKENSFDREILFLDTNRLRRRCEAIRPGRRKTPFCGQSA